MLVPRVIHANLASLLKKDQQTKWNDKKLTDLHWHWKIIVNNWILATLTYFISA